MNSKQIKLNNLLEKIKTADLNESQIEQLTEKLNLFLEPDVRPLSFKSIQLEGPIRFKYADAMKEIKNYSSINEINSKAMDYYISCFFLEINGNLYYYVDDLSIQRSSNGFAHMDIGYLFFAKILNEDKIRIYPEIYIKCKRDNSYQRLSKYDNYIII